MTSPQYSSAIEEYSPRAISHRKGRSMQSSDIAVFNEAVNLANSGNKATAYQRFQEIRSRSTGEDTTLLYWIAYTTPSPYECQDIISRLSQLDTGTTIYQLRDYYNKKWRNIGPLLYCPYCQRQSHTFIKSKVTVGGWILLVILLISPLLPFFWIGLLFREPYNACGRCGAKLGA